MSVSFLEASNKTCIVYSSIGIKHMGKKYEKERNIEFLKLQRMQSFKIVINSIVISFIITYLIYLIP
jgi:hypothetical protein